MQVLGLLARKGGAGKTTLAAHLAVLAGAQDRRVLMVDTDPQKSLTKWWRRRPLRSPALAEAPIERLKDVIEAARDDGIDLVVIDTRPSVEEDTVTVAKLADYCLIPTRPAILDLDAIEITAKLLQVFGRPGAIVLNACQAPRGVGEASLTVDARRAASRFGLPVAPVAICDRVAMGYALTNGAAVTEFEPNGKASAELRRLWTWVEETAWPRARS